jgi:hypothetical protein
VSAALGAVDKYNGAHGPASIRAFTGRSYGFVHRLLSETGVQFADGAAPPGAQAQPNHTTLGLRVGLTRPGGSGTNRANLTPSADPPPRPV